MQYDMISADGHVDLIWLPPDLFTANASAPLRDRMPYVEQGPAGARWVSRNGGQFGLVNGMGSGDGPTFPARSTGPIEWPRPGSTTMARRASGG